MFVSFFLFLLNLFVLCNFLIPFGPQIFINRLLASDTSGLINIWDRRASNLPCLELTTNSTGLLNSIKLSGDNEVGFK